MPLGNELISQEQEKNLISKPLIKRMTVNLFARTARLSYKRCVYGGLGFKCARRNLATGPNQPLLTTNPLYVASRSALATIVLVAGAGFVGYSCYDADSAMQRYVFVPFLRATVDGETSHWLAVKFLETGFGPRSFYRDPPNLAVKVWGKTLSNPLGLAAGMDKNGQAIDGLYNLGFSYVEIGSVTPLPQPGNPKPRFFRLIKDRAVINRYGFNSDGQDLVLARLQLRTYNHLRGFSSSKLTGENKSLIPGHLLAVNLGKNKNGDEVQDYVQGVRTFGSFADVLVINISSPNTPNLRSLQSEDKLNNLVNAVLKERNNLPTVMRPPLLIKVAPDLNEQEIESISKVVKRAKVDGVIVGNTTISRPASLKSSKELVSESGGLSGPPLKPLALQALRSFRKYLGSDTVLIGCGGIRTGKDAIEFAKAGATFIQAYTEFAFDGTGFPTRIKREIEKELQGKQWMEIIGTEATSI